MSDQQTPSRGTQSHSRGRSGTVAATGAVTGSRVPQARISVPNQSDTTTRNHLLLIPGLIFDHSPGSLVSPASPIQHERMPPGAPPMGVSEDKGKTRRKGEHTRRPLPSDTFDSGVSAYLRLGSPRPGPLRAQRNAPRSVLPAEGADNGNRAPDESQRRNGAKKGLCARVGERIKKSIC